MWRPLLVALLACCCCCLPVHSQSAVASTPSGSTAEPSAAGASTSTSAATSTSVLLDSSSLTHFSFGSCNKQDKPQPMWQHVMERKPQLWIWLGDVIYADRATLEFFRRPSPLADMKKMYEQQYRQTDYTRLRHSDTKIVGIYDDHDYGENDGDSSYVDKEPARHLFLDFVDEPADSPRRHRLGVYESYKWGSPTKTTTTDARAAGSAAASAAGSPGGGVTQLILLDSRYHQDGSTDEMLGAAQWAWLESLLSDPSPVDLFVVGSGVQLVSRDKRIGEGWRLMPKSRARLLDLFARRKHNRHAMILFLSGDVHFAESDVTYTCAEAEVDAAASGGSSGSDNTAGAASADLVTVTPFYELTSSGLTHSVGGQFGRLAAEWGLPLVLDKRRSWASEAEGSEGKEPQSQPQSSADIAGYYPYENFADVQVDWIAQTVRVEYVGVDGTAKLAHTLPFDALRSRTLPRAQLPPLVSRTCADEARRARSPPMWVLPGVKAGLLIVAALLAAMALAAWILMRVLAFVCGRHARPAAVGNESRKQR